MNKKSVQLISAVALPFIAMFYLFFVALFPVSAQVNEACITAYAQGFDEVDRLFEKTRDNIIHGLPANTMTAADMTRAYQPLRQGYYCNLLRVCNQIGALPEGQPASCNNKITNFDGEEIDATNENIQATFSLPEFQNVCQPLDVNDCLQVADIKVKMISAQLKTEFYEKSNRDRTAIIVARLRDINTKISRDIYERTGLLELTERFVKKMKNVLDTIGCTSSKTLTAG